MSTETIELRAHHVLHLHRAVLHGIDKEILSKYITPYIGQTIDFEIETYRKIIENPNIDVKIIDSLDVLCDNCVEQKPRCTGMLAKDDDIHYAKLYGLEIRKIYSSEQLVEKLKSRDYPSISEQSYILDVESINHDEEAFGIKT